MIDIPNKRLNLQVSERELNARRKQFKPRPPAITTGYLARYARQVTSASTSAIFETYLMTYPAWRNKCVKEIVYYR
jgi:dihydroxy-acid dehydratase